MMYNTSKSSTIKEIQTLATTHIRMSLLRVMEGYIDAKRENFGGHALGHFVRREIPKEFTKLPSIDTSRYKVMASVGQGNWAAVPWIAIMNSDITTSTQRGYYIVYLFSEDMSRVYLTIAQGVTETSREDMEQIKEDIRAIVEPSSHVHKDGRIDLGDSTRAKDYEFSTAVYVPYSINEMPQEKELIDDLQEMITIYEDFILHHEQRHEDYPLKHEISDQDRNYDISTEHLVDHIFTYIKGKGFIYTKQEVTNLFLSLKTKPFVILSGISGTGKTMMAKWFAESIGATEDNGQFMLIPVRPDWNDGSDLLGYIDIKGDFKTGPLTEVIKRAADDPDRPYIVLLDEMNLARVEYYFSDILSVMESRRWENGHIKSSNLLFRDEVGFDLSLPNNLYVIGTVNMDETTHPFSKKVLDRANTIEFNRVDLGNLAFLEELEEIAPKHIGQKQLGSKYLHLKDVYQDDQEVVEKVTQELIEINQALEVMHAHVGYRVRDEISFYMAYNEEANLLAFEEAFDYCILQKILPRISGSDSRVHQLLTDLYRLFTNKAYDDSRTDVKEDISTALYPHSATKVFDMLRRLEEDGFTSFWVS